MFQKLEIPVHKRSLSHQLLTLFNHCPGVLRVTLDCPGTLRLSMDESVFLTTKHLWPNGVDVKMARSMVQAGLQCIGNNLIELAVKLEPVFVIHASKNHEAHVDEIKSFPAVLTPNQGRVWACLVVWSMTSEGLQILRDVLLQNPYPNSSYFGESPARFASCLRRLVY